MKVVPKRKWRYPLALEREYSKYVVKYVEDNMAIVKQFIPQMEELLLSYALHVDADSAALTQLEILLDKLHAAMKDPEQMTNTIRAMSIRVDRYNQMEWDAITKSVLGMPMSEIPFERLHHDAEADDSLRALWVAENLDLIKSVDQQTMQRIKQVLQEKIVGNVNRRELAKDLAEEIEKITGLEKNRAMLIARDQIGKLNSRLTQYRQEHAGIEEYKWSTSHDRRVRPAHRQYDGQIYTWGSERPAPEGPPGTPIRCRCTAIPVIELDKIVTKLVPQSYVQVKNTVQIASDRSIITTRGGESLEQLSQARKKDHAFEITNTAIEKVSKVKTPKFSELQNNALASLHREVLRIAKIENSGNEVALVSKDSFGRLVKVLGSENYVDYVRDNNVVTLKMDSSFGELVVAHNHPTTRNFSFADISVFVYDEYVATLSVVTNQGQVYILQKQESFNYGEAQELLRELLDKYEIRKYPNDEIRQKSAAKEFIKRAGKVGIWYGTGKGQT